MTIEVAKQQLKEIKRFKQRAMDIQKELSELENNLGSISAASHNSGIKSNNNGSVVERLVMRLNEKREQLVQALNKVFDAEDKLTLAISELNTEEQDIIIGYYLRQKIHRQLAREMNYSEAAIKYKKNEALKKIAKGLKV